MDTVVTSFGRSLRVSRIERCRSEQGQSGIFGICDGCLNYESPELSTSKKSGSARQSAVHRRGTDPRPSSSSKGSEATPRDLCSPFLPHPCPPISLSPVFSTLRTTSIYANRTTILTENPQLWMWRMVCVTETGRFFQSAVSFKSLVDASPSHPTTKFDTGYQTTNNKGPIAVPHSV